MKKTVLDQPVRGKRVIIRSDLNVPIENGEITDDTRIKASLETIKYVLNCPAKVIVLSHLGRVKTEADREKYSLQVVAKRLSELLKEEVKFINATRGLEVEEAVLKMKDGEIILLENTRFEDLNGNKESGNDDVLSSYWASLGEVFINDAFGAAHRRHASNVGIAKRLPNAIGFLVKKELEHLTMMIEKPKRPLVIILGGAKVKDKIGVLRSLVNFADYILIGGGMSLTFLKALGYNVGSSFVDEESLSFCKEIYQQYQDKIILPNDVVVGSSFTPMSTSRLINITDFYSNDIGMDIGVQTINNFKKILMEAKTIFWNGPVGVFEVDKFNIGTRKLCEILTISHAKTIIGGGDTAFAVTKFGFKDKVTYLSTGGGAALKLIEGKSLPAIEIINDK
jgi:phosphoglycerate kinase